MKHEAFDLVVIRGKVRKRFDWLDGRVKEDSRLSLMDVGMLLVICNLPEGWMLRLEQLSKNRPDKVFAMRQCLARLRKNGYGQLVRIVDSRTNKVLRYQYEVSDEPIYDTSARLLRRVIDENGEVLSEGLSKRLGPKLQKRGKKNYAPTAIKSQSEELRALEPDAAIPVSAIAASGSSKVSHDINLNGKEVKAENYYKVAHYSKNNLDRNKLEEKKRAVSNFDRALAWYENSAVTIFERKRGWHPGALIPWDAEIIAQQLAAIGDNALTVRYAAFHDMDDLEVKNASWSLRVFDRRVAALGQIVAQGGGKRKDWWQEHGSAIYEKHRGLKPRLLTPREITAIDEQLHRIGEADFTARYNAYHALNDTEVIKSAFNIWHFLRRLDVLANSKNKTCDYSKGYKGYSADEIKIYLSQAGAMYGSIEQALEQLTTKA